MPYPFRASKGGAFGPLLLILVRVHISNAPSWLLKALPLLEFLNLLFEVSGLCDGRNKLLLEILVGLRC